MSRFTVGRAPSLGSVRVLMYHAISDLAADPILERYGVPPVLFRRQIERLGRNGWQFITPEAMESFLHDEQAVPPRSVLLTFDDCYDDLSEVATFLAERDIPALAFAVSGLLGRWNSWDSDRGAERMRLLDAGELIEVERRGITIGSHGRSHRGLIQLSDRDLAREVSGSGEDLRDAGLAPARSFAYPFGEHDSRTRQAVRDAGYTMAFTADPGVTRPGADVLRIPRIEVTRRDTPARFMWKVLRAGHRRALRRRVVRFVHRRSGASSHSEKHP